MQRHRILISSGIFPNRILGNRGIYNLKQAIALRSAGCEVKVVAPVPFIPRFLKVRQYAWQAAVPREDDVAGFRVTYPRYFVTPKVLRSLHGFFLFLSVVLRYRRIVSRFKPDVIYGFFAYPYGFANAMMGRLFGVPVVTYCRGSDIHSIARNRLQGRLIAWSLRLADRVLSVSEALKKDVVALGVDPDHVTVVHNGIEPDRFTSVDRESARRQLSLPADGALAVCVSRLSGEKGIDVLIDSIAYVKTPNFMLVLVGDGPQRAMLEERARSLGVAGRVLFAGDRPHDEVPLWVSAANLSVLGSRKEGYPNAVVESLACGRPVVATDVGGVREILTSERLGLLVAPEDAEAFGAAVEDALGRPWDTAAIEAVGKSRDWAAVARDVLNEFDSIIKNPVTDRSVRDGAAETEAGSPREAS
jgi:teichuronic acid biosynthesis glycosyltransferase TuaC